MKRIKFLTPLIGLTALTPIITLSNCGGGGSGGDETPEQEAKHVKTTYEAPKVGEPFVVTFTLDNGYALDVKESEIVFADSNAKVNLSQCVIDTSNKKITVPKDLVTSTQVTVSLKSVKPQETTAEEKKTAIANILNDYDNKNLTLSGTESIKNYRNGEYIGQYNLPAMTMKMVGHNAQIIFYDVDSEWKIVENPMWYEKATDIGWWAIQKGYGEQKTKYIGTPLAAYPIKSLISLSGLDYEQFIKNLKYDAILDCYSYNGTVEKYAEFSISFTFNHNKEIKNIILYAVSTYGESEKSEVVDCWEPTNKGSTSLDATPTYEQTEFIKADEFDYSQTYNRLETGILSDFPKKVFTPKLTDFETFDPTKKTYIYITGVEIESIFEADSILYNGSKQLKAKSSKTADGDYYVNLNKNKNICFEINANVLNKDGDLRFVYSYTGGGGVSTNKQVIVTQTEI